MISMDKKYRTRNGNPVRILCVDKKGSYPVVVLIGQGDSISLYQHDGRGCVPELDLIEVKPDTIRYARVYKDASLSYASKTIPNEDGCGLGFVKITVPDGGEPTFEWNSWQ